MYDVIGQEPIIKQINSMKNLPQFIILLGPQGSGRSLIAKYIAQDRDMDYIEINNKIADIRILIDNTVGLTRPTMYFIQNADELTLQAANAMLKIAEEPPQNLYLVMGLVTLENTISTIVSRATVLQLEPYTISQLQEFYKELDTVVQYEDAMLNCLSTPGDIKTYINTFDSCYEYVQLVYKNILKVRTGNAFKISNKIDFKEVNDVITPKLFLSVFLEYLRRQLHELTVNEVEAVDIYRNMIFYTNQALIQLNKKGANKKMIFDLWVLNIRTLR